MNFDFDIIFKRITWLSALFVFVVLFSIFVVLYFRSTDAISAFGIDFLFTIGWSEQTNIFGGLPAILGSIISTFIAMLIATPLAIGVAIFLTEVVQPRYRTFFSVNIEMLAAIPSIIYGMWGLFYFVPLIREIFGGTGIGLLTASIVLSIMILPFIAAVTRDSMNTTPAMLKESAYALGATKFDVIKDIVIPFAKAGILGSIILALGRAFGETMAVAFVIGNTLSRLPENITEPATSIPALLANNFQEAAGLQQSSLFLLALILFIISFIVIAAAKYFFLNKKRGM